MCMLLGSTGFQSNTGQRSTKRTAESMPSRRYDRPSASRCRSVYRVPVRQYRHMFTKQYISSTDTCSPSCTSAVQVHGYSLILIFVCVSQQAHTRAKDRDRVARRRLDAGWGFAAACWGDWVAYINTCMTHLHAASGAGADSPTDVKECGCAPTDHSQSCVTRLAPAKEVQLHQCMLAICQCSAQLHMTNPSVRCCQPAQRLNHAPQLGWLRAAECQAVPQPTRRVFSNMKRAQPRSWLPPHIEQSFHTIMHSSYPLTHPSLTCVPGHIPGVVAVHPPSGSVPPPGPPSGVTGGARPGSRHTSCRSGARPCAARVWRFRV